MSKQAENAQVKLGAHETDAKSAAADSVPAQPSAPGSQAAGNQVAGNQTAGDLPEQFGRYQIKKRLGKGAMGAVYLAHDTQLDRQVALKVPFLGAGDKSVGADDRFAGADDRGEWLERFYREARAAAGFHHANLCPVYDVGQIDGIHYLTMAFIDGPTLAQVISRGGGNPQPEKQAAGLVRKLALALAEAHRHGVAHRDLKPSNIMLDQRHEPIVMDFGLARRGKTDDPRLTRVGSVMGTPSYMPPEQVLGQVEALGPPCDIYSLGVILYELLCGKLPFEGPTAAVFGQILAVEPDPPSRHRPGLAPALDAICAKAMAKKAQARFASMEELAAALTNYLRGGGVPPPSPLSPARPPAARAPAARRASASRQATMIEPIPLAPLADLLDEAALARAAERERATAPRRRQPTLRPPTARTAEGRRGPKDEAVLLRPLGYAALVLAILGAITAASLWWPRKGSEDHAAVAETSTADVRDAENAGRPTVGPVGGTSDRGTAFPGRPPDGLGSPSHDGSADDPNTTGDAAAAVPGGIPGAPGGDANGVSAGGAAPAAPPEKNLAPTVKIVSVEPEMPEAGGSLLMVVEASDPEGDPVTIEYRTDSKADWRAAQDGRVTIPDLAAGPLTVYVRARDGGGNVSVVVERSIEIKPAWPAGLPALAKAPFSADQAKGHQAAWATHLECKVQETNSIGMKLALIPPGEFLMGSPASQVGRIGDELQHRVRITKPFYLGVYEVTQKEYQAVMGTNPSHFSRAGNGKVRRIDTKKFPVETVSWDDANEFCRKLSARAAEQTAGCVYRLPTEAEWEYACRAGSSAAYCYGDDQALLPQYATFSGNANGRTWPAGTRLGNAWGLFDMHGNVWEWCWDLYGPYGAGPLDDPVGPVAGDARVLRGAAFLDFATSVRSANRDANAPATRSSLIGFRVARTYP